MTDILLKDIPPEDAQHLSVLAAQAGKDRHTWLREQVMQIAAQPAVRARYEFKAFGENGAYITITRRYGTVQHGAKNCSQAQFDAYEKATLHCQRNEPGDYEAAYKLLLDAFDEVFAL